MKNTVSVFYANILDAAAQSDETVEAVLEKAKNSGITALDFDYETVKNGLPDAAARSGMRVNSIYAFIDFTESGAREKVRNVVELAESQGAIAMAVPKLLIRESAAALKAAQSRTEIFAALDALDAAVKTAEELDLMSRYGRSRGVPVCVENFDSHRSLTERSAELEWLFGKAQELKFNLDTGNSVTCGEDAFELYKMFGGRIVNVHCKDRAFEDGKYHVCAAGAGEMPVLKIRDGLVSDAYAGGFSVEVFGTEDSLTAIKESAENLLR